MHCTEITLFRQYFFYALLETSRKIFSKFFIVNSVYSVLFDVTLNFQIFEFTNIFLNVKHRFDAFIVIF